MRLLLLLTILTILNVNATVFSQNRKIDINAENVRIRDLLREVELKSGYAFFFNDGHTELNNLVSLDIAETKVEDLLEKVLKNTHLGYKILENKLIVIVKKENKQEITVKGKITDSEGNPLPGVNIVELGTTSGAVTDLDGNYSITVSSENAILRFSYIGYLTEEIEVGNQTSIDVILIGDIQALDEVVVVGYGTQKKVNLTGSIVSVNNQDFKDIPVQNPLQSIQGKTPGLQIVQQSGEPGDEEYQVRMRGLTSYGAENDVLVIIDGVQGSLSVINPHDIESISVLKDASSCAIYGARAANGVILVTTKSGKKSPMTIEYNINTAIHSPVNSKESMIDPSNSLEYIDLRNKALQNTIDQGFANAANKMYSEEQRAYYTSPDAPNFDWYDYMLDNQFVQDHHLSSYGGSDKARYNVSMGYFDQPGTLRGHEYKKYTAKMKTDFVINKNIEFGMNMLLEHGDRIGTFGETTGNGSGRSVWLETMVARPTFEPQNAQGNWVDRDFSNLGGNKSPAMQANHEGGYVQTYNYFANADAYLRFRFLNDFTWNITGATQFRNKTRKEHKKSNIPMYTFWDNEFVGYWANTTTNSIEDTRSLIKLNNFYTTLNYTKSLNYSHNLNILLGHSIEKYKEEELMGARTDYPSNNLDALSAGSSDSDSNSGGIYEWSLMSLFGRFNYDYQGRYLLEASFRYDGSSRFATKYRWGFFPSFSAGWRISEESFMENVDWMDNLKFRGSWGQLGNQDVGTYPYQDNVSFGRNYIFGDEVQQGAYISKLNNEKISWETTKISNAGIDLSIFKGIFSLSFDVYDKTTTGIIRSLQVPDALGLSGPVINDGEMKNTGFEFIVGHNKQLGDLRYQVEFSGGHFKNEVVKYGSRESWAYFMTEEGIPYNSYYMYEFDGIFQSEEEIEASPTYPYSVTPGAIKLKDQNGDNIIDSEDRVVVDGMYPKFDGGLNLSFWYKNFDLSVFFYGVYGRKYMVRAVGGWPFSQGIEPDKFWADSWTPENHSNEVPILIYGDYNVQWFRAQSDFWLNDADYVRLKNLTLGYNVPLSILGKRGIKDLRIFFSGQNLLTLDNMKFSGNPEKTDNRTHNADYPHNRILSFGVTIKL